MTNEFNPNWRSAPGESIKDILDENSVAVWIFADDMGMTYDEVNQLLIGEMTIDEDMAIKISKSIGATPEFWLERERRYRIPL